MGGGRIRLKGLYHDLGLPAIYLGSFDWPGERSRKIKIGPTLTEIDIPLGEKHFKACSKLLSHKRTIVDTTFPRFARHSSQYCQKARSMVQEADIVVFSHPWVFPVVRKLLDRENQLIVYDAQNVEGYLRYQLLNDNGGPGTRIVREVIEMEGDLLHLAHLILACSREDARLINHLYKLPFEKIRIMPNGAFIKQVTPIPTKIKNEVKKQLGFSNLPIVIFLASDYEPNLEAARFIRDQLAPQLPEFLFLIAGGVGSRLAAEGIEMNYPENIRITGLISESEKLAFLTASDLAINPIAFGSGSNIKMFEFMAAGLPIVTTSSGARGIESENRHAFWSCETDSMADCLKKLATCKKERRRLSLNARKLVENKYSWDRLSARLGALLHRHRKCLFLPKPFFSVIIPTYNRHKSLNILVDNLVKQTYCNMEIIIVDQSTRAWPERNCWYNQDLLYVHEKTRGAARARNVGAFFAQGSVLAFIDDDCQPRADWLEKAAEYFSDPGVVGVEGLIRSEKVDLPGYRVVENENFRGIGFMTANLFLRMETFMAVHGFDEMFDNPHFREDTDLAWRALDHGQIPFGFDVQVFHPAHPRKHKRESLAERNIFFEKDALLLKKHPERFKALFVAEQANKTKEYWKYFVKGCIKYGVRIPGFYRDYMKKKLSNHRVKQN